MMRKMMSGWLPLNVPFWVYLQVILLGMGAYFVVEQIVYRNIKRIPLGLALKNVE